MQSLYPTTPNELSYRDLVELYAYPGDGAWLRANFVTSIDGAAQGSDHRSASLSSRADKRVFGLLRTLADVIVVGASTARAEGYLPVVASELRTSIRSPPTCSRTRASSQPRTHATTRARCSSSPPRSAHS